MLFFAVHFLNSALILFFQLIGQYDAQFLTSAYKQQSAWAQTWTIKYRHVTTFVRHANLLVFGLFALILIMYGNDSTEDLEMADNMSDVFKNECTMNEGRGSFEKAGCWMGVAFSNVYRSHSSVMYEAQWSVAKKISNLFFDEAAAAVSGGNVTVSNTTST